jgi:hypothetical protein
MNKDISMININNLQNNQKSLFNQEKNFFSKVEEYFMKENINYNKNNLQKESKNLFLGKIKTTQFLKNLTMSSNKGDFDTINTILEECKELTTELRNSTNQKENFTNNNKQFTTKNTENINQTKSTGIGHLQQQILGTLIVGFVKKGKIDQASKKLNNNSELLEKVIDFFLAKKILSKTEINNILKFIQTVVANGLVVSSDFQQILQKKYKKLKDILLKETIPINEDEFFLSLSEDAQEFIKELLIIREKIEEDNNNDNEMLLDDYEKLLSIIEGSQL